MNLWIRSQQKKYRVFLSEYGNFSIVITCSVIIVLALFFITRSTTPKKLEVTFLDIGQGDAILIETPEGHDILIDGGPSDKVLEELSRKMNYFDRHLDVVVSTHPDADHVTGLLPVLKKYEVDTIITSPSISETGIFDLVKNSINEEGSSVHIGKKGDSFNFGDGVVMHILYPNNGNKNSYADTNSSSVSVLLTYGNQSVLLTGDLPSQYEGFLLQEILPKGITIYKAGHHGSKYSSGDHLLSYIRPEYAVISAGKNNKYGHPDSETVERLTQYSKHVISTVESGRISFQLDGVMASVDVEH